MTSSNCRSNQQKHWQTDCTVYQS